MKRYITIYDFLWSLSSMAGIGALVFIIYLIFGDSKISAEAIAFGIIGALIPTMHFCYCLFCAVFRIKVSTGKETSNEQ